MTENGLGHMREVHSEFCSSRKTLTLAHLTTKNIIQFWCHTRHLSVTKILPLHIYLRAGASVGLSYRTLEVATFDW